jgi:hypothetical protein
MSDDLQNGIGGIFDTRKGNFIPPLSLVTRLKGLPLLHLGHVKHLADLCLSHCLSPPSDRGPYDHHMHLIPCLCTCTGCAWEASAKWSGEWQISRNFGACGAAGKFFSKFRETLANPKHRLSRLSC